MSRLVLTNAQVLDGRCPNAIAGLTDQFQSGSSRGTHESLTFMYDALSKAEASEVRILPGDEYGGPGLNQGEYGRELHSYVHCAGMPSLTVIGCRDRNAAALIDQSYDLGRVEPGKIADLLVLARDPAADIAVIADQRPIAVLNANNVVTVTLEAA